MPAIGKISRRYSICVARESGIPQPTTSTAYRCCICGKCSVIIVDPLQHARHNLFLILHALGGISFIDHRLANRNQNGSQNPDDRDYNKQFHKRECH